MESTSTQTPSTTPTLAPRPKGDPPDPVRHPGSPPSSTSGHTPSSPPPGPPARPPLVPERPPPPTSRTTTTRSTGRSSAGPGTTQITAISLTRAPPVTTPRAAQVPPTRQYLCNVTKPEMYLVRVGKTEAVGGAAAVGGASSRLTCVSLAVSSRGSAPGFSQVREVLRKELNGSVELQVAAAAVLTCSGELTWRVSHDGSCVFFFSSSSGLLPALPSESCQDL